MPWPTKSPPASPGITISTSTPGGALFGLYVPHLQLAEVYIEDESAGSFDDVTLHYESASGRASHFVQVKYHVDQRNAYSTTVLLKHENWDTVLYTEISGAHG